MNVISLKPTPSYVAEIQAMMYGFGDSATPRSDSAALIEEIVHRQISAALDKAAEMAAERGGPGAPVTFHDVLFLFRKSPIKLQRLVSYLKTKDLSATVAMAMQGGASGLVDISSAEKKEKGRVKKCKEFAAKIDVDGSLTAAVNEELYDGVRYALHNIFYCREFGMSE